MYYLVIEKVNFYTSVSPSFRIKHEVQDHELAQDLRDCLVREAKEKNDDNKTYGVVLFDDSNLLVSLSEEAKTTDNVTN